MIIWIWIVFFVIIFIFLILFWKYKKDRFTFYNCFLIISFLFVFISFFEGNFTWKKETKITSSNIVFVLDVSKSMLALDYSDLNRLDLSKKMIKEYVVNNPDNKYWLIIFAWDVVESVPLIDDVDMFLNALEVSNTDSILKWWTDFVWVIDSSISMFEAEKLSWWVVIFSDFEDNSWDDFNLDEKFKNRLKNNNIKYILYWIWSTSGNFIPYWLNKLGQLFKTDKYWKEIITKLDLEFLEKLNKILSWEKYIVKNENDTIKLQDLPSIQTQKINDITYSYSRYIIIFSYLFFILFLINYFYYRKTHKI